jgi:hypothetical protein
LHVVFNKFCNWVLLCCHFLEWNAKAIHLPCSVGELSVSVFIYFYCYPR